MTPPFGSIGRPVGKSVDQFAKGYYNFAPGETWTPNVNLYETDNTYLVCVDLAGVEKDKIDVTIEGQQLKLRGQRAVPMNLEGGNSDFRGKKVKLHLMEIDHGSFVREVELPEDIDREQIAATYRNGLLWVEIPRK